MPGGGGEGYAPGLSVANPGENMVRIQMRIWIFI